MISRLSIENYALIERSVIDFGEGFIVITGETGAGKSIMLDALTLLMGARADTKAMGNKEKKTVVEGIFSNPDKSLQKLCEANGIDWDEREMIIRREILPSGKSRSFVNDSPVNLSILGEVAEKLLDIHSQHSNTLLNRPQEQLAIIDSFGNNSGLLNDYRVIFKDYVALRNKIKKIREAKALGKENREFLLFRLEQLDKIKPKRGELALLEKEFEILGDADRIKSNLGEAYYNLGGGNESALRQVQNAASIISDLDLTLLDPEENDNIIERLNNLKIELRDISDTLENYAEQINSDPVRYDKVQKRIGVLYETMKRFKVKDEEELANLYEQLKEELASLEDENSDESELESQLKLLAKDLKEKAEKLSESRLNAAEKFSRTIEKKISPLGLPNIKFKVDIEKGKMTSEGQDIITFLCSFNKNHVMQPISEIASGGEISRVMLGIKSLMAETINLPTVIFDEIDTGVSGEIAHKMGKMMKDMSGSFQVIAVTHLPQVAASGDSHYKVYKADDSEKTISHIRLLNHEERVKEIAGMLSGTTINEIALENAKILLDSI